MCWYSQGFHFMYCFATQILLFICLFKALKTTVEYVAMFWRTQVSTWSGDWSQRVWLTNYVDQQSLKPDDDYVLPQRLWTFDILVCPLSATERFLLQPLVCGTVFYHTSLLSPLSPSSALVLNHTSSHRLRHAKTFELIPVRTNKFRNPSLPCLRYYD